MKIQNTLLLALLILVLGISCTPPKGEAQEATITSAPFGKLPDGQEVTSYTMTNVNGVSMDVITYGGIVTSLMIPDREGKLEDVVLGYDNIEGYLEQTPYFGAIIGRYGNRIADAKFTLDSVEYSLAANNGPNHLHGGEVGFDKVNWTAKPLEVDNGVALELSYVSADMEEGYPGTLTTSVIYTLTNDNDWIVSYEATTDKKTVVNLTQHAYFNFTAMKDDILSHELKINAPYFLPVDSTLIPTGELRPVEGTPFDFTESKVIGAEIDADNQQIKYGPGYDHCWVLAESTDSLNFAASLYEPTSGRLMEIYTEEPAIQFYAGNFLDGTITGKEGKVYNYRTGLCLETQHYPDSPNQSDFPSVVLNPGETYRTVTVMKFSTK
ncbi:aldose epimerase family protein [Marinoscillum sp. MHG1-6]|uniref:aldose epimerase family protein n=1 Tax=Marinoscillum sp. MHG1-6 TaxID=2959627 RepID=UPI002157A138|nr:aldose epimerase family protein [Marinoscillum sp. MHG1-6]